MKQQKNWIQNLGKKDPSILQNTIENKDILSSYISNMNKCREIRKKFFEILETIQTEYPEKTYIYFEEY